MTFTLLDRTESRHPQHKVTELDIIDLIIISVLRIRLLVKSRVFEDRLRSSEANEGVNEQRTRVVLREAEGSKASTLSQPMERVLRQSKSPLLKTLQLPIYGYTED